MKVNFFQYFNMSLKASDKLLSLFQEGICVLETNMRCVPPAETYYHVEVRNFSIIISITIYI